MFNYDIYEEPHLAENPRRRMQFSLRKKKASYLDLLVALAQRMKVPLSQILLYRLYTYNTESFGFYPVKEQDYVKPLSASLKGKGKNCKAFNIKIFYVALRGPGSILKHFSP